MKRARSWRVGDEAWSPEAPVPVRIVEDHHYALRHVHGGIRRHRVPASGLRMLHFDSHPDLLVAKIPASTYSDATALYDALDSCEDGATAPLVAEAASALTGTPRASYQALLHGLCR